MNFADFAWRSCGVDCGIDIDVGGSTKLYQSRIASISDVVWDELPYGNPDTRKYIRVDFAVFREMDDTVDPNVRISPLYLWPESKNPRLRELSFRAIAALLRGDPLIRLEVGDGRERVRRTELSDANPMQSIYFLLREKIGEEYHVWVRLDDIPEKWAISQYLAA